MERGSKVSFSCIDTHLASSLSSPLLDILSKQNEHARESFERNLAHHSLLPKRKRPTNSR